MIRQRERGERLLSLLLFDLLSITLVFQATCSGTSSNGASTSTPPSIGNLHHHSQTGTSGSLQRSNRWSRFQSTVWLSEGSAC
jgi:hypothetical protein